MKKTDDGQKVTYMESLGIGYNSVMAPNPHSCMNQGVKKHFIILKKAQPCMYLYVVIKERKLQISHYSYSLLTK